MLKTKSWLLKSLGVAGLSIVAPVIIALALSTVFSSGLASAAAATTGVTGGTNAGNGNGGGSGTGVSGSSATCIDGSTPAPGGDAKNCVYCSDNTVAPTNKSGNQDASLCFQNASKGLVCGRGSDATKLSINIGCKGEGNPIADAAFAIIRFLSDGVGLVIIASIIVGGIQYSSSRGDPQSTAKAVHRIQSTMIALLIFIFSYAILNYLIPGQVLK